MKVKKGYVDIIALFALSLMIQNSYASADASWWSRLTPSTDTLTGTAWVAPFAVAAQRRLASDYKLPSYTYFIPGALGAALGTVARSDQGWVPALAASLWHNSPSFGLAAALWALEKLNKEDINDAIREVSQANLEYKEKLAALVQKYQQDINELLVLFEKHLNKDADFNSQNLITLYKNLAELHNDISATKHYLKQEWKAGRLPVSLSEMRKQQINYLMPPQELYATYIAYFMAQSDDEIKALVKESYESVNKERLKEKIIDAIDRELSHAIQQLKNWGLSANEEAAKAYLKEVLLDKDEVLLKKIFERIKKYSQNPSIQSDLPPSLDDLVKTYAQKVNNFVNNILSDNPSRLDLKYSEINELYSEIRQAMPQNNQLLAPYDYIYADIISRIIKSDVTELLDVANDRDRRYIVDLMLKHKYAIKNIYNRLDPLATHIALANQSVASPERMEALLKKVMTLINEYNGFKSKSVLEEDETRNQQKASVEQLFENYKRKLIALIDHITDLDINIEQLYLEIKKSYRLYQDAAENFFQTYGIRFPEPQLRPYEYIYAAIAANVIALKLPPRALALQQNDMQMVFDMMRKDFKSEIDAIVTKSKSLANDLNAANTVRDEKRDIDLIVQVINLINGVIELRKASGAAMQIDVSNKPDQYDDLLQEAMEQ